MSEKRELQGSVVVITGASSGIGLATAKDLVARGARVVAGARDVSSLSDFVSSSGGSAVAAVCDIRKPADCAALMELAVSSFGRIDSLVANAGIGLYGGILDYSDERLNEMMETNLQGTIWTVRAAVPFLKKSGGGDILIVASVSSYRSKKNQAVYAATKHGQVGLAIGLDDELREDGIRVTLIAPAATETNFAVGDGRSLSDDARSGYLKSTDIAFAIATVLEQPRRMRTTVWQMISMSQGIL
jgi:3-oxoacyl-[acyl-carrier protein] reductase